MGNLLIIVIDAGIVALIYRRYCVFMQVICTSPPANGQSEVSQSQSG